MGFTMQTKMKKLKLQMSFFSGFHFNDAFSTCI